MAFLSNVSLRQQQPQHFNLFSPFRLRQHQRQCQLYHTTQLQRINRLSSQWKISLSQTIGHSHSCVSMSSSLHVPLQSLTSSSSLFSSSSSSFEPPEPPNFNGQPVYPDIDLSISPQVEATKRNLDTNAVFVVTGASRGIGLQMVKSLSQRTKGIVIACCRSPDDASQLHSYIDASGTTNSPLQSRIKILPLDLEDQDSIDALAATIQQTYNRVDILLNVAGILGDGRTTPGPERSIRNLDRDWVEKTFQVNYIGPVFLSQALAPMMKTKIGSQKRTQDNRPISVIANLSARVGSISDNGLGGWISYRSSKTALNQATKTMSLELKRQGTFTLSLHPGTTDTDLSKPFQRNVKEGRLFPVEFTVEQLLNVIDGMDERHTGGFYDWSGTALPF